MKWFDRWLTRRVRSGLESQRAYDENKLYLTNSTNSISPVRSNDSEVSMDNALKFVVLPALGGTIVEVRHPYDQKLDRSYTSTHVIPDGEDITESIGRIVTTELLKKG